MGWKKKVKITVLKRLSKKELYNKSVQELAGGEDQCEVLKEGQEFIVGDDGLMPKGFCGSAWADIYCRYRHLSLGGDYPWIVKKGTAVTCCGDGFRPVLFKLERIDDKK